jgi:hypothetical protein
MCNARIIFQHINTKTLTNVQDGREFQALSESVVAFFQKHFCTEVIISKQSQKATKTADFWYLSLRDVFTVLKFFPNKPTQENK